MSLPSSVSYGAQQPWLESATVRDNILFGHSLDESRLKATIKACALETDLALFPDGDLTFCGERGISLSGGQAARVALARAIYAPSEVRRLLSFTASSQRTDESSSCRSYSWTTSSQQSTRLLQLISSNIFSKVPSSQIEPSFSSPITSTSFLGSLLITYQWTTAGSCTKAKSLGERKLRQRKG